MPQRAPHRSSRIIPAVFLFFVFAVPVLAASPGDGATGSAANAAISQPAASANNAKPSATTSGADSPAAIRSELEQLKSALQAESQEFAEHSKELDSERAALKEQLQQLAALEAKLGITPGTDASAKSPAFSAPLVNVSGVGAQLGSQDEPPINIVSPENPLSMKIGGAEFTPGGYVDLTGISRSADVGSGLGTNFTALPYNNSLPLGRESEFRFTGQGSRISLRVDANPTKSTTVAGYFESDFNGYEPANSNISTKSDSFRLRLAFVQLRHHKWEVLAGQTWSFLTPTREGLSPFPDNVFTALRLDTSYLAGLVYGRQPELRLIYHATDWWSLGVALANPQQFVPSSVVFPTDGNTNFFSQQFDNGSSSTSATSATINPTVPNLHPDIIAKTAFDWRLRGKLFHVDADGVLRTFRVFNNLETPQTTNKTTEGGGLNANFEILKNFHLVENSFYGDGVGRYIGGLGPDVVVRPDGHLSPVRAASGVAGFEWQTTPNFLVDGYYSGAYFWRNYATTTSALGTACGVSATPYCVGFGFPGSANTNNRDYQEASVGFIPTIWSSRNYGKLEFISQFSYVVRTPWYVAPGSPKNAHVFITYIDLRYILP